MKDLRDAIKNVLIDAGKDTCWATPFGIDIQRKSLVELQAEFNIYFVEPENEQTELVSTIAEHNNKWKKAKP